MKSVYRTLNNLCQQMWGDSTLDLPTDYERCGESDTTIIKGLYTLGRMAQIARNNSGQVVHMAVNAMLALPIEGGVHDVDIKKD